MAFPPFRHDPNQCWFIDFELLSFLAVLFAVTTNALAVDATAVVLIASPHAAFFLPTPSSSRLAASF
jgi:hypothetical protein